MPEVIKCKVCQKEIKVKDFADQMKKLRRHMKTTHPRLWRESIMRGVAKREESK